MMDERECILQLLLSKSDELGLVYFGATGKPFLEVVSVVYLILVHSF